MAQENAAIARTILQSLNPVPRNEELEAFLDQFIDPDVAWYPVEGAVDSVGVMRGIEAVRRHIENWHDLFDNLALTADDIAEIEPNLFLVSERLSGRAKTTGLEAQLTLAVLYTFRDGRLATVREYVTKNEALAAMGLSEQAAHAD